ncbi:MAG: tRNA1(Val) (adenine(37)-N6)-methyltransferase [Lachnospiraceae bacterium]|nr:tRNA1(Val) (adenine(37)-N6)-methyltransferase [Lachnospiraceae bacterium]
MESQGSTRDETLKPLNLSDTFKGPEGRIVLNEGERLDDLQINGLHIIQNKDRFCFGIDAVLLSGYAVVKKGETVLDIGTGTGVIPILLTAKTEGAHFTGIEIQKDSAELAKRNAALNGLSGIVDIICGDIRDCRDILPSNSVNVITSNPPYMINRHGLTGESFEKAAARHEILCTFEDIARESKRILKEKGRIYLIHRPFRLADVFESLKKYSLEPKRLRMVQPYIDKEPSMVLIEAVKGGRPGLKVEKPLVIYKELNVYTQEVYEIYGKRGLNV